jgi:hypothetical protein
MQMQTIALKILPEILSVYRNSPISEQIWGYAIYIENPIFVAWRSRATKIGSLFYCASLIY